ncbi:MAG: hypothetical protein IK997_05000 [Bacilli bacterium]|nr:hypothetical protein [Bacilli bacterium]
MNNVPYDVTKLTDEELDRRIKELEKELGIKNKVSTREKSSENKSPVFKSMYDAIVSPIDSDETILEIVDIYANKKVDGGSDIIRNGVDMYSRILDGGRRNELDQNKYSKEFYINVVNPNLDKLFINTKKKGLDYIDIYDKSFEETIKKGYLKEDVLTAYPLYPLKRFKEILKNFNTYYDFVKYVVKNNFNNAEMTEYASRRIYGDDYNKKLREKLEKKYSADYIDRADLCLLFNKVMHNSFLSAQTGSMGFHINPNHHEPFESGKLFDDNIKLYINAEEDTYKFSRLFQEECEKRNLAYYYKVACGDNEFEFARKDKMCIYSSYENVVKYMRIISKIKKEHPEIKFSKPPISTGLIAGYIGVGQDVKGETNNKVVAKAYFDAVNDIFKDMPREKIMEYMKLHPEYIEIIRKKIKEKLKESGMSDKQGIYETEKETVKKLDLSTNKRNNENNKQDIQQRNSEKSQMISEWHNIVNSYIGEDKTTGKKY